MDEVKIKFDDFLMDVEPENLSFVLELNDYLLENGCSIKIQAAKSGYVVSYTHLKKVLANYVFRKNGMIIRIYGNHIGDYNRFLNDLPDDMVKAIQKAPVCKRLLDSSKCNSRCPMGYTFLLKDETYKKCRYSSFMFPVNSESGSYIKVFLENEIIERTAYLNR